VLEWVRSKDNIWSLPPETVDRARRALPDVALESPVDGDAMERLLPEAEVVLGWAITPKNFSRAKNLRWIHATAAGVRPLMFPELIASDVRVSNSRGLHAVAMAEHALGMMLEFARKLHLARDAQGRRDWAQIALWSEPDSFRKLAGSTLGLVGLGAIGGAIASRARVLGMSVIAVRRHPSPDGTLADEQLPPERLGDMLARAEWVVLAAPQTAATENLIGARELEQMRRDAVLVNLGRGALVDEPALIATIERGRIAGAALDVTVDEPLPADSPLWTMPNVIVSPHISGLSADMWERAMDMFVEHVHAYQAGRPLPNLVDKRAGY
jgi:phosphoglycerate dehydrogenase-like enzyme